MKEHQQASKCFEQLVCNLNLAIRQFDPNILILRPKDMIYELAADASRRPSFRAYIAPEGMRPIPTGYFLCIRSGNRSFLGGGLHSSMFGAAADLVRRSISRDPLEWIQIIENPAFRSRFAVLGDPVSKFPNGFDPSDSLSKYFQQNNWYVRYPIQDATLLVQDALESIAIETFEAMAPFIQYLNRATQTFHLRA